jgi:hypothetical protein
VSEIVILAPKIILHTINKKNNNIDKKKDE